MSNDRPFLSPSDRADRDRAETPASATSSAFQGAGNGAGNGQGNGAGSRAGEPSAPSRETAFRGVVKDRSLRGLTLICKASMTILVDVDERLDGLSGGAVALRLLAGIVRPRAGLVRALGVDPSLDATLRRDIALLGDDVLLDTDPKVPLRQAAFELAAARRVDQAAVARIFDATRPPSRREVTDALACADRARLLLVSYPERYVEDPTRSALHDRIRQAIARNVPVVIATSSLDDVLFLASAEDAQAAVLSAGVVTVVAPAQALPFAVPLDGLSTRLVRVVLGKSIRSTPESDRETRATSPSAQLAADLLSDPNVAPSLAMVEPQSPFELRIHTRDPRVVARAIAERAHRGLIVQQFAVHGSGTHVLRGAFGAPQAR
ncbi:MAG: hypothetical protein NVS3B20_17800 [Polyangiales bacterium]